VPMATVYRKAELTHLLSQSGMAVLVWGSPVLGRRHEPLPFPQRRQHCDGRSTTSRR
jgi:hypothetical protein